MTQMGNSIHSSAQMRPSSFFCRTFSATSQMGIAKSIIKEDGTRLSDEEQAAVSQKLRNSGYGLGNRLANEVLTLNGLDDQAQADRKNVSSEAPLVDSAIV